MNLEFTKSNTGLRTIEHRAESKTYAFRIIEWTHPDLTTESIWVVAEHNRIDMCFSSIWEGLTFKNIDEAKKFCMNFRHRNHDRSVMFDPNQERYKNFETVFQD